LRIYKLEAIFLKKYELCLPSEYLNLLSEFNGFEYNGFILYVVKVYSSFDSIVNQIIGDSLM